MTSAGTLRVVTPQSGRRIELSVPAEQTTTRPSWVWLATSDTLVALVVFLAVSNLLPGVVPSGNAVITHLQFILISWLALAAAMIAKRVYPKARRHIAPTPADDLMNLEAAIAMGALVTFALAAIVPSFLHGALRPGVVAVAFAGCAIALPLGRAVTIGVRGRTAVARLVAGERGCHCLAPCALNNVVGGRRAGIAGVTRIRARRHRADRRCSATIAARPLSHGAVASTPEQRYLPQRIGRRACGCLPRSVEARADALRQAAACSVHRRSEHSDSASSRTPSPTGAAATIKWRAPAWPASDTGARCWRPRMHTATIVLGRTATDLDRANVSAL